MVDGDGSWWTRDFEALYTTDRSLKPRTHDEDEPKAQKVAIPIPKINIFTAQPQDM